MVLEQKAYLIDQYAKEWFKANKCSVAKPKDLMPFLIERGLYERDIKEGLPLRNDLRELDQHNLLHLIECLCPERKKKNTYWYFML